MRELENQKGITLVSLVITIIIMLILASVSVNLVAGSKGIMRRANDAVNTSKEAQMDEEIQLRLAEVMMDYYSDTSASSKTLEEYIIDKCETGNYKVDNGYFSVEDGTVYYTNASGKTQKVTF